MPCYCCCLLLFFGESIFAPHARSQNVVGLVYLLRNFFSILYFLTAIHKNNHNKNKPRNVTLQKIIRGMQLTYNLLLFTCFSLIYSRSALVFRKAKGVQRNVYVKFVVAIAVLLLFLMILLLLLLLLLFTLCHEGQG